MFLRVRLIASTVAVTLESVVSSMRNSIQVFIVASLLALSGCPDKEKHASIEAMNEGIKAAQLNSYSAAIKHLKKAIAKYPDNHQALYTLGQIYSDQGKWDEAVKSLEGAVRVKKNDAMYQMLLGIAEYNQGKGDVAQKYLEKAVELEERLARAHFYLGRVFEDKDQPQDAAKEWTRAAMLDPTYGKPFVYLGKLYLMWDMVPEAIRVLEQGKDRVLGDDLTNVFYYLGLAYDAEQNWDKSIEAYSAAIDAEKGNLDAKFQRGLAYAKKGDKRKGRTDLQEYVKAAGDNSYNMQEANKVLNTLIAE